MDVTPAAAGSEALQIPQPDRSNAPSSPALQPSIMPSITHLGIRTTTIPDIKHERISLPSFVSLDADGNLSSVGYNKKANHRQQEDLVLLTRFALYYSIPYDNQTGRIEIQSGTDFPVPLQAVDSNSSLRAFQLKHFWFTYGYHGLGIDDIAGYEVFIPDQERLGGYEALGFCSSESQWQETVAHMMERCRHECPVHEPCNICASRPILVIHFRRSSWIRALGAKRRNNNSTTLTLLDGYNGQYGTELRNKSQKAYDLYLAICQKVYHDLRLKGLSGLCALTPGVAAPSPSARSMLSTSLVPRSRPRGLAALDPALRTPGILTKRPRASSSSPAGWTAQAISSTGSKVKRTRRLEVPKDAKPPRTQAATTDYSQVVTQPTGDIKLESDKCFTCVNLGKSCAGRRMINGRCEMCAKKTKTGGTRKCYWRKPGIDTYGEAKATDENAIYNEKNTRAGRAQRARYRRAAGEEATGYVSASGYMEDTDYVEASSDGEPILSDEDYDRTYVYLDSETVDNYKEETADENASPTKPKRGIITWPQEYSSKGEGDHGT